jgi:PAS domain-containing protein
MALDSADMATAGTRLASPWALAFGLSCAAGGWAVAQLETTSLFSTIGLVASALLGATLLLVRGRARGIDLAVRQRTSALEAQVGERKIAEAALRDSEQRFRNILDNVPIGVIYTDLDGDVIQANPRFCELVGHTEAELLSLRVIECTHPDDVAEEVEMAAQLSPNARAQGLASLVPAVAMSAESSAIPVFATSGSRCGVEGPRGEAGRLPPDVVKGRLGRRAGA